MVQMILQHRDYQQTSMTLGGVPELLQKINEVIIQFKPLTPTLTAILIQAVQLSKLKSDGQWCSSFQLAYSIALWEMEAFSLTLKSLVMNFNIGG